MKRLLIACSIFATIQIVSAQEHLPRNEALKFAFYISADMKTLQDTPIPTDVDLKNVVAMRHGEYGALVLPEAKLTAQQIKNAGETVIPVGQIWMHRLAPIRDGEAVSSSKLRVHHVEAGQDAGEAVQCALGVKKSGSGGLELLIYGKDKTPVLQVPLKAAASGDKKPVQISAEQTSDEGGKIILNFAGEFQASIPVTELGY